MAEQLQNFGVTTLNEVLDDTETAIDVVDGSVFPATGDFRINCQFELMKVTARTGNTLTVERGSEGTTATTHTMGATVKAVLTATSLKSAVSPAFADAKRDTDTAVSGSYAPYKIAWETENRDDDSFIDVGGANPTRFTANGTGVYLLACQMQFTNNSGERLAGIYIDGAGSQRLSWVLGSTSYYQYTTFGIPVYLTDTQYVEYYVEASAATTLLYARGWFTRITPR